MEVRSCEAADIEQAATIFCQAYAAKPYDESWMLADASAYQHRRAFLAEQSRDRGVARTLVKRINGGSGGGAWLVAHRASGAGEFYERLGFRKDGPYEFYYGSVNP